MAIRQVIFRNNHYDVALIEVDPGIPVRNWNYRPQDILAIDVHAHGFTRTLEMVASLQEQTQGRACIIVFGEILHMNLLDQMILRQIEGYAVFSDRPLECSSFRQALSVWGQANGHYYASAIQHLIR